MKTAILSGVLALVLSLSAYAGGNQDHTCQGGHNCNDTEGGSVTATSASESRSDARANADALAVAKTETVVDASSNVAVGVKTGIEVETGPVDVNLETGPVTVDVAGDNIEIAGPDIDIEGDTISYDFASNTSYAPPSFSNIRCGEVAGIGYTNTNGSGSLGIPVPRWLSRKIRDCEADADANWLAEMGMRLAAIEARCGTKSMQDRFGGSLKGQANRTTACRTRLVGLMRDEAELEGLRSAVEHLNTENAKLSKELGETKEAVDRCTNEWVECQAK